MVSPEEDKSTDANGFLFPSDDFGFVMLHTNHALKADPSSTLSVGDQQNVATQAGFYATDVLMAKIHPVTEQWDIASATEQLSAGGKWILRDVNACERVISIERVNGDQILLKQQDDELIGRAMLNLYQRTLAIRRRRFGAIRGSG